MPNINLIADYYESLLGKEVGSGGEGNTAYKPQPESSPLRVFIGMLRMVFIFLNGKTAVQFCYLAHKA